ncbi:asparagine synthase (glutamine-hydrolyzing) [Salinarimonas sp.]|uniref:asparagine synthase (glutamine-hydrolyzing) n=1 Tax=Salinarimonas sp. TaxID=2766526 RepID=UPI0032D8E497
MCGIAGLIDPALAGDADALAGAASAMGDALAHRGPDGAGVHCEGSVGLALAHRRLAILGIGPGGDQPMISADGRYVLVYNGEIYGHETLRAARELRGLAWRGRSDTESLLESIACRGLDATLADIDGMFAFAVYDRREQRLHLVRDPLGIKPLFYARQGRRILFGSELKALRAAGFEAPIDPHAVAAFLRYGYVPAPYGILEGLRKVLPGEHVAIAVDGAQTHRLYWSLEEVARAGLAAPLALSDEDATDALDALLARAVRSQTISEAPIGSFLSGGIDSSTVTALMAASSSRPVRTFSIGFPEFGFDEGPHARAVAAHLGTRHTALEVSASGALDVVPLLPDLYDEPFADSSQIPTHILSALARRDVTVALSGDGGDELFAGYNRHVFAATRLERLARVPKGVRRIAGSVLGAAPPHAVDALSRVLPGAPPQAGHKLTKLADALTLDGEAFYRRLASVIPDPRTHIDASEHPPRAAMLPSRAHALERMRLADALTYLPDDVLQKVDRASMAVALEVRPPLLDAEVVRFAWRLPHRQLVRDGRSKWLLRRVVERRVPARLLERPKAGFAIPLASWLRGPLATFAGDLLTAPDYGGGLLRPQPARRIWEEHRSGRRDRAHEIWTLVAFESWRRRWASGSSRI